MVNEVLSDQAKIKRYELELKKLWERLAEKDETVSYSGKREDITMGDLRCQGQLGVNQ